MDFILSKLECTNITSNERNWNSTSFNSLYKNWGRFSNQEERRKQTLETQKNNRYTKLDKFRGILHLVEAVEGEQVFCEQRKVAYRPKIFVAGFNQAPSYSEVLMLSEWMVEKPEDFETNWVVVPAPKAIRVLLVASNGSTRLYTKHGHLLLTCRTGLPGGNNADPQMSNHCCVLDGFYHKKKNTFYVMDMLAWNSLPMTDGEFEFRDYWIRMQLPDLRNIKSINKLNELNFNLLPKVSCAQDSFRKFMIRIHFNEVTDLDGLLFFHKKGNYQPGETPLVGWLLPFMVPEVLGSEIIVYPAYMIQKPENYTNQAGFISDFEGKRVKKTIRRADSRITRMETATPEILNPATVWGMDSVTEEGEKSMDTTPEVQVFKEELERSNTEHH